MYASGEGVKSDMREAFTWYSKAADFGHVKSQNNLANIYMVGIGVVQNYSEAARWYKKAADGGNFVSLASLAELYQFGEGVEQDEVKAVKLYKTSAEQGHIKKAMNNLGFMYLKGHGVKQNYVTAYKWFSVAELNRSHKGNVNKFDMLSYVSLDEQTTAVKMAKEWMIKFPPPPIENMDDEKEEKPSS